uniref:Tissue factor pathway inhibitor n=1 Tax=Pavo cristatus TaxID=9049 RepID=A0A8C9FY50_PAVCR
MAAGRCLPLPALLLPLACAALAPQKQRACLLPPDDGPCRALVPRWYYDRYTQSCQEFTYGGCHGNANNFLSHDDCEKSCWTIKKVPKLCRMEADTGPCRGYIRRYAFNLSSMRCEEFIYGGCYGNGNNFKDLQSCVDHCLPEKSNGSGPLLCYSPKDEGLCSSSVPRYYYDTTSKSCKEFKYTGCGGNANNFVTEVDWGKISAMSNIYFAFGKKKKKPTTTTTTKKKKKKKKENTRAHLCFKHETFTVP